MTDDAEKARFYHAPRQRYHRASISFPVRLVHILDILAEKGARSRNRQIEFIVNAWLSQRFPGVAPDDWPAAAMKAGDE